MVTKTPESQRAFQKLVQARGQLAQEALRQDPLKFTINMNSGQYTESGSVQIANSGEPWTELKIKEMMLAAVGIVMNQQARLDNPVQKMFVDGSPFKVPSEFKRNLTLLFNKGNDVRNVMNSMEAEVRKRIPGTTWAWKVVAPGARKTLLQRSLSGSGPVYLEFGDQLLYVPTSFSGNPDPTYGNVLFKGGKAKKRRRKGGKTGRTGGKGWYGLTATVLRGIGKQQGVYVRAVHSLKFVPPGRRYPPGVTGPGRVGNAYYQGSWAFIIRLQFGSRGRS